MFWVRCAIPFQFCPFDATTNPFIKGSPSEHVRDVLLAQTGHYCLPHTSDIQYHAKPMIIKDFKDFVMSFRKEQENKVHHSVPFEDPYPESYPDENVTFIIIEALVLIITGLAVALIAWCVTESQVNIMYNFLFFILVIPNHFPLLICYVHCLLWFRKKD